MEDVIIHLSTHALSRDARLILVTKAITIRTTILRTIEYILITPTQLISTILTVFRTTFGVFPPSTGTVAAVTVSVTIAWICVLLTQVRVYPGATVGIVIVYLFATAVFPN